uniref:Uncharacterized protein n=1 Tax=Parascaris univalens TaxID=6257 RepID=A0A915ABN7_PARUN
MCCVCVRVSVCHASITKIHRQLSGSSPGLIITIGYSLAFYGISIIRNLNWTHATLRDQNDFLYPHVSAHERTFGSSPADIFCH